LFPHAPPVPESGVSFRHAVFPDLGASRALNLAPAPTKSLDDPDIEAHGVSSGGIPRPHLSDEQQAFVESLFRRCGLHATSYKVETLARRLPACLRALKAGSVEAARSALRRRPELCWVAIDAVLIGVTGFFRDPPAFAGLCGDVLPALAGRRDEPYRIWSAGCSTGAELYSVALLLAQLDALDARGGGGGGTLLGTDCRPDALAFAARGRYAPPAVRDVPPSLLAHHFSPEPDGWRLNDDLRAAARWARADVMASPADAVTAGPWDLILCRNLAIYLQPDAASRLWSRLAAALKPGGVLMLGRAERPLWSRLLEPIGTCLYRRKREE
jgi:chemotaxis methyl-accepting protein methylase